MSRLSILILSALLAFTPLVPSYAQEGASENPIYKDQKEREAYAREFAQAVISILHDPKHAYNDRKNTLRHSFADSVDTDWIAKFVLGRAWRDATPEQQEQYVALYRKFLTETYITNFAENPQKSIYGITVLSVENAPNDEFEVHTRMQLMNQTSLKVDYRVHDDNGHYRVRDIVIEHVSLIATHRDEFTQLAAQGGVGGVINKLSQILDHGPQELALSMQ